MINIDEALNDDDENENNTIINPETIQDDHEKGIKQSTLQILEEKKNLINKISELANNFLYFLKIYIKINDNKNDSDINNRKDKMNEVELEEKYIVFF